jgi:uncharacterized membrane protein YfcA
MLKTILVAMEFWILPLIGIVAYLYASVGHGGASGFLALMALFGFAPEFMRSSSLLLNVFVASIAFIQYHRQGHFKWAIFLPFAIGSIPMSFLGGSFSIDPMLYKKILGVCLIFAILRLLGVLGEKSSAVKPLNPFVGLAIGLVLGFISGLIGIGGGIILSPIILIFHWANMKTTAAVSALFILVNSLSGLAGLYFAGNLQPISQIYLWVLVAVIGGWLGSYAGSARYSNTLLEKMLAVVLVFASLKLIFL